MNVQENIEKGILLPIMEEFYSIQGEGNNSGVPSYFIRLAGCDVGCVWCDVKESWEAGNHPVKSIKDIVDAVLATKAENVVITGGEPLMYDLNELSKALKKEGLKIFLETSGAYEFTGEFDWVCFSPKKFKAPKDEVFEKADELKVIVFNKHDLQWGAELKERINKAKGPGNCKFYFQPEWEKKNIMLPLVIDFVKENPEWNISLQTHKYMNIP